MPRKEGKKKKIRRRGVGEMRNRKEAKTKSRDKIKETETRGKLNEADTRGKRKKTCS